MPSLLITPPAVEPITLDQAKDHLRVTNTTDDALISTLIAAARRFAEGYCRRALITQVWDLYVDKFPDAVRGVLEIPFGELQAVTSVTYYDADGALQTLSASLYQVEAIREPARIRPIATETWPATYDQMNAVTVRFTAGYGDAPGDVPEQVVQAMLMLIGHLYENRESSSRAAVITEIPMGTEYLLDPYIILKDVH